MVFGTYILALATLAITMSAFGYLIVARGNQAYVLASRWFYYLGTGLVIIASIYLVTLFLNNRFEFAYVAGYSSTDLATNYKVTSFWAGQEGSFLLWALFGVLLGLWVRIKAKEQLGWVMFFYLLGLLFLFALLNISSPFRLSQFMPVDGNGLNPLLQNYWMQIHPPIVFLGYVATFVPFAFAMAALATNKYDNWVRLTFPWAIFSVFTLGTGIFLGGYWAYETLGWGGYWGWDPVENASLVPWLGSIALVHGMILERHKGSFRRTNLFLAITTFLMVIYGTFLTRSGVLADFSVHSFVDLGMTAYLVLFLVGFAIVSYGLWAIRSRSISSAESGKSLLSTEFTVYLAMLFLILSAFLVLLGTSSPLITRLFGDPSAVDTSFYVLTNLPIGIILGLILGLSGVLSWRVTSKQELLKRLPLPIINSLVITLIAIVFGITNLLNLVFIFTSSFAFSTNFISLLKRISKNSFAILHADLVHAGVGLLLIGIIVSSVYRTEQKATLPLNEAKEIKGFQMNFQGVTQISQDREQANIQIERGSSSFEAKPVFVWSNQGLVRNPYIKKYLLYDLYISPEEVKTLENAGAGKTFILTRDQAEEFDGYMLTFTGFDATSHSESGAMSIGAIIDVTSPDGSKSVVTPVYEVASADEPVLKPAKLPGTDKNIYLLKLNADNGLVMIGITDSDSPDEFNSSQALIVNVTKEPLINFVWLGLLMIIAGSAWGTYKRIKEVK